jgi:CRISPR-associated endonuclease/helicase Cas3
MNLIEGNYNDFFRAVFGEGEFDPFDYQRKLAEEDLSSLVNVPTGAGKTKAILGAWLWRRWKRPETVGRRLVYCLPMRTLVEQTRDVAETALQKLHEALPDRFSDLAVHVLMGGDASDEWDSYPERECILIGTQDMLLSRALNRGYAMSRFRWPLHFGLLNNDCLWVFDEIQLMSDGLATSAQLAAFRAQGKTFGNCHSLWMSATLDRNWLRQIDFAPQVDALSLLELSDADRATPLLAKRLNATKDLYQAPPDCRLPAGLARFVKEKHLAGTQTLIVVNTVNRAREVFDELNQAFGKAETKGRKKQTPDESLFGAAPEIELIHSRFRPAEREQWKQLFNARIAPDSAGRIIVATQVVEAGVDISSRLLITDLAPFSSLVQRFGRCNRTGDDGAAEIYWVDRPLTEKTAKLADEEQLKEEDLSKLAKPYEWQELQEAEAQLQQLSSASPSVLTEVKYRAPYTPAHVLRRRDLVDLFDTTPDLSGYDLDVSRFVRGGEERDVSVAWREWKGEKPAPNEPELTRRELCNVPLHESKEFLKKTTGWTWDALEGDWRKVNADELRPGLTILLNAAAGGYDVKRGWDAKQKTAVPIVSSESSSPNEAYGDDLLSWREYTQTLAAHSREARQAAERILTELTLPELNAFRDELLQATHHHDWGKAHQIFQLTLHAIPRDADLSGVALAPLLAKSASHFHHRRKRFRHELASALALLQTGASDLMVYLAACHHGKVRLNIRALPDETRPEQEGAKFARGIHDDDELPAAFLGDGVQKEAIKLNLEPMLLGRSATGAASWLERMLALRDQLGVFRLAYLECLIRAADVQASMNPQDFESDAKENKQ